MLKKVIVTGANGFIGTALLNYLQNADVQIYAVVRDKQFKTTFDQKNVQTVFCDMEEISKLPELIPDRDIDGCIHLAWGGNSGGQRADFELQLQNVKYSLELIKALDEMKVKRFIGAGTLAEKDVLNYHLQDGSMPNITSMYGIAKLSAHLMTKTECVNRKIEHVWCYLSNTYGEGNTTNNFVNMAAKKFLKGEHAAFTPGEQLYDFVHVDDTIRALYAVAQSGKPNAAYYLGSTKPEKLKEYIRKIRDAVDPTIALFLGEIPFNGVSLPPEEYDTTKLIADTDFSPSVSFSDGIQRTVVWLKENMSDEG